MRAKLIIQENTALRAEKQSMAVLCIICIEWLLFRQKKKKKKKKKEK